MLKGAIARRYAAAIFDLARKQNALDRTLDDVQEIAKLFAIRKLAYLLREPKIPAKRKETAIRQALASRVLPTSLNLALLIVQRELVDYMPNIAAELEQLVLNYRNEAIAQVTTAEQMDEAQSRLVQQALERRTGKTVLMQPRVDPGILGGVIARVGDEVIDGSVRYRLHALQQQLLSGVGSTTIEFLSPEELTHVEEEIADVANNTYSTIPQGEQTTLGEEGLNEYHTLPEAKAAGANEAGHDGHRTLPDTKPPAYRS